MLQADRFSTDTEDSEQAWGAFTWRTPSRCMGLETRSFSAFSHCLSVFFHLFFHVSGAFLLTSVAGFAPVLLGREALLKPFTSHVFRPFAATLSRATQFHKAHFGPSFPGAQPEAGLLDLISTSFLR